MAKVTQEQVEQEIRNAGGIPMSDALAAVGITKTTIAKQLKRELRAKEIKFHKIKRDMLTEGVIAEIEALGGPVEKTKDKYKTIAKTSAEILVAVEVAALGIRQHAREDAQKLLGLYPAEKYEHSVSIEDTLLRLAEQRGRGTGD